MKSFKLFAILSAFIFAAFVTACSDDDEKIKFDKAAFDQQRSAWLEQNIQNYTFSYNYFSSGTGPVSCTVVIGNGVLESITSDRDETYDYMLFKSITAIYDDIDRINTHLIDEGLPSYANSVTINVTYNSQFHYPLTVNYPINYNEDILGGGYPSVRITKFEVLD